MAGVSRAKFEEGSPVRRVGARWAEAELLTTAPARRIGLVTLAGVGRAMDA